MMVGSNEKLTLQLVFCLIFAITGEITCISISTTKKDCCKKEFIRRKAVYNDIIYKYYKDLGYSERWHEIVQHRNTGNAIREISLNIQEFYFHNVYTKYDETTRIQNFSCELLRPVVTSRQPHLVPEENTLPCCVVQFIHVLNRRTQKLMFPVKL